MTRVESQSAEDRPKDDLTAAEPTDAHLRRIIDTIPVLAWCNLPDGSNEFLNQRWQDYTGLSQQEACGWGWQAAFHPDDLGPLMERWRLLLSSGEADEIEARLRRYDGVYRWFLIRVEPFRDAVGTIVRWYGTSIDIEDRKQAEERVRGREHELRQIVNLVPHHIAVVSTDGTGVYANQVMLDYYGLTAEFISAPVIQRFTHPDDVHAFMATWQRGLRGTAAWETEARFRRRDGEYRWFLTRVTPLADDAGRIVRWYATGTDIDDRKKAEDKVHRQERELHEIVNLVPHHIAVATLDGRVVYGNQAMLDYYGLTLGDVRVPVLRERAHPDDIDAFTAAWLRAFVENTGWQTEARFRGRDGEQHWFLVTVTPLRDDAGRIVRWYVTGTDIDDRKRAEARIRQDERELRTIVDFLPQLLVVADAKSRVAYANRACIEFTGLTLEAATAHPDVWTEIVHPDDLPAARANVRRIAEEIAASEVEVRMRGSDGQYRWILCRYAPLRDADGHFVGWFAAGTDIDVRKRAEQRMHDENLALREEVDRASMFEEIVGASPALRAVLTSVAQVAPMDSTVLVTGETGTGKELVARAIHRRSPRAARAFVSVNCAAIPSTLIASELFGHEKGAFTGALQRRAGRFELADGGTIFLDEVGDLPADTQLALLRVLQEREIERIGSTRSIKVDVRVIAATNRDLEVAIERDAFRADLFYRLNVFPIEMPPLRERVSDIPLLVAYFVDRYGRQAGKTIRRVDKATLDLLKTYRWPGNVRELQNVVERAVIICDSGTLTVDPHWLSRETARPSRPLGDELVTRERQMIETALAESRGRVAGPTGAAARLGLHPSTLDSKIRALRIDKHRFKRS